MSKASSQSGIFHSQGRSRTGWFAISLFLVALLQSAALAWMIYDRINLLETGKEIVLDIVPVDPRSLFRGDYVILSYGISRLELNSLAGDTNFKQGSPAFLTIRKPSNAAWQPVSITKIYPQQVEKGHVVLRGKVKSGWQKTIRVHYGIENYFVQEGHVKVLEQQVRERKLQVLVAIRDNGEAAIKGLLVGGKLKYKESLF
jgi:uncharacterized membrane-anchored protein